MRVHTHRNSRNDLNLSNDYGNLSSVCLSRSQSSIYDDGSYWGQIDFIQWNHARIWIYNGENFCCRRRVQIFMTRNEYRCRNVTKAHNICIVEGTECMDVWMCVCTKVRIPIARLYSFPFDLIFSHFRIHKWCMRTPNHFFLLFHINKTYIASNDDVM